MSIWEGTVSLTLTAFLVLSSITFAYPDKAEAHDLKSVKRSSQTNASYTNFLGERFALLDTYEDPELVKEQYLQPYSQYIATLKSKFHLEDLSPTTASIYKNAVLASSTTSDTDVYPLLQFLDTYENEEENSAITQQFDNIDAELNKGTLSREEALEKARIFMPDKPGNGNDLPVYQSRNSGISLPAARSYAKRYATSPNPRFGVEKTKVFLDATAPILLRRFYMQVGSE